MEYEGLRLRLEDEAKVEQGDELCTSAESELGVRALFAEALS